MNFLKGKSDIVFYVFLMAFITISFLYKNAPATSEQKTLEKQRNPEITFREKSYHISFSDLFSGASTEISDFGDQDRWQGPAARVDRQSIDADSALAIRSADGDSSEITMTKAIDLSSARTIKMLIYSDSQQNGYAIKEFALKFHSVDTNAYLVYPILNLQKGWNVVIMPTEEFVTEDSSATGHRGAKTHPANEWQVDSVAVELVSRPHAKATVTLDRLWAENDESYQELFNTKDVTMLSLKQVGDSGYVNIWQVGGSIALLRKVTSATDFTYTAKLIPERPGNIGITVRTDIGSFTGYYLEFSGVDTGTWRVFKNGAAGATTLDRGEIRNYAMEAGKPVWMRMKTTGNSIKSSFSVDGRTFIPLSDVSDDELPSGGIGIHTATTYLLDSVDFEQ